MHVGIVLVTLSRTFFTLWSLICHAAGMKRGFRVVVWGTQSVDACAKTRTADGP